MSTEERRVVPLAEAIARIGDGPMIHTFMSGGFALLGADHGRDELIAAMSEHGVEDSGAGATAMGHTLVIVRYPLGDGTTTPLFIEAAPAVAAVDPVAAS